LAPDSGFVANISERYLYNGMRRVKQHFMLENTFITGDHKAQAMAENQSGPE
jgi:hypothetical protein